MKSFVRMRLGLLACVMFAGMSIIPGAEGAIIVKSRSAAPQGEPSAEDKAAAAAPRKAAELALNVSLPFDKISQIINQFEYRFQAKGTAIGFVDYNGTLKLENIRLTSSGLPESPLRAIAPFKLVATVAGRPLNLSGEATIDFGAEVGSDWCPVLTFGEPSIDFSDKAAVAAVALPEKADKSIPSLAGFVASHFLSSQLKESVTCEVLKKEIAKLWGPVTLPITAAGKKLFLKFDPQSLSVSRFAVGADRVSFSLSLGALTTVLAKAPVPKKAQLPGVKSIVHRPPAAAAEAEATLSLPIGLELR